MPTDKMIATHRFDRTFDIRTPNRQEWSLGILYRKSMESYSTTDQL